MPATTEGTEVSLSGRQVPEDGTGSQLGCVDSGLVHGGARWREADRRTQQLHGVYTHACMLRSQGRLDRAVIHYSQITV